MLLVRSGKGHFCVKLTRQNYSQSNLTSKIWEIQPYKVLGRGEKTVRQSI
jgi:hypothetical protein